MMKNSFLESPLFQQSWRTLPSSFSHMSEYAVSRRCTPRLTARAKHLLARTGSICGDSKLYAYKNKNGYFQIHRLTYLPNEDVFSWNYSFVILYRWLYCHHCPTDCVTLINVSLLDEYFLITDWLDWSSIWYHRMLLVPCAWEVKLTITDGSHVHDLAETRFD